MARRRIGWACGASGAVVLGLLAGCGGGGDGGGKPASTPVGTMDAATPGAETPPGTVTADAAAPVVGLRVISEPLDSVVVGETLRYRMRASEQGAHFDGLTLPAGALFDASGNLSWTPSADQGGAHKFSLRATAGGQTVLQQFSVLVGLPRPQRTAVVDPNDSTTTTITVDAPLSPIRGAGLQIDPGSVVAADNVSISISSLDNPPVPPLARIAGVPDSILTTIELGPSGTAFRKPVRVQLPASSELLKHGKVAVVTMDPTTGAWERVKVLAVDETQGVVTAEIQHFSTYVLVPDLSLFKVTVGKGGTGTTCADSVVVHAALAKSPAGLPANLINGYSGSATDLAAVLGGLTSAQALQAFIHVSARNVASSQSEEGWLLVNATRDAAGQFQASLSSHRQTAALLSKTGLGSDDPSLWELLAGSKGNFVFGGLGDVSGGVSVTTDVSFYLVNAADANQPPGNAVSPVARETIVATALTPDAPGEPGYDRDCDQIPDGDDPLPDGDPLPRLAGMPAGPLRLLVGQMITLAVSADPADTTFTWTSSDPALGLLIPDAAHATLMPTRAGAYQVAVQGTRGTGKSRLGWDVLVDEVAAKAANTPPEVQISASQAVLRVGDTVTLQALGRDREQVDVQFRWRGSEPGLLSADTGGRVAFKSAVPGDFKVTCVGNDGLVDSAPATVALTVLAATTNRPPEAPVVTPLSALVTHAPGEPASVFLQASATDPDGEAVMFDFVPDPSVSRAVTLNKKETGATISTVVDGSFVFHVTAQDIHGATSPATTVRVQVLPSAAIDKKAADNDGDGYPVGADCNDNDAKIFPGSPEICGDGVDQDCDGRDLGAADCDLDGDTFSAAHGDCDDHDRKRNPAMPERCDGVDNNCNGVIDDGFEIGKACANGVGACRAEGKTACSASFVTVVCDAQPGKPGPEICDMIDNDCNGRVDDVMNAGAGTLANCGACGVTCAAAPGTTPLCANGGCVAACNPGFVDLDRDPRNGCECALSNKGIETCDGIDNDCNGQIDDHITQSNYTAAFVTLGIGICSPGAKICKGGMWVEDRPAREPAPEICDGLDNDCNGIIDDGIDFVTDGFNCGACGVTCGPAGRCLNGKCSGGIAADGGVPLPPPPSGSGTRVVYCPRADGTTMCVDLQSDPGNCGACGKTCPAGTFCTMAACLPKEQLPAGGLPPTPVAMQCPPPGGNFDGGTMPPPGPCVPECPATMICSYGRCIQPGAAPVCPPELITCPGRGGEQFCTKILYDPSNCGTCGLVCAANTYCNMGKCELRPEPPPPSDAGAASCPAALATCSPKPGITICTDLFKDRNNCGGCNLVCPPDLFCDMGKCVPPQGPGDGGAPNGCPPPLRGCGTATGTQICVDVLWDRGNCGACGLVCPPDQVCNMAKCLPPGPPPDGGATGSITCPPGDTKTCKDPAGNLYCAKVFIDSKNCGDCAKLCAPAQACVNAVCVPAQ